MTDKLTIGQEYSIERGLEKLWTLFRVVEEGEDRNGINEFIYHFGTICNNGSGACFGDISIPGSRIILGGKNRIKDSEGRIGCGFAYGYQFQEYLAEMKKARRKPKEVEVERRPMNEVFSLEDFQLLIPGIDIVRVHLYPESVPGLFRRANSQTASFTYRMCNGIRKKIIDATYPFTEINIVNRLFIGKALEFGKPQTYENTDYHSDREVQPSSRFTELDTLLKSRGI